MLMARSDAECFEGQVWPGVEVIINDPNRLESLLKEIVDSLKNREEDLNARIKPIDARLAEIAEQKARLADDWVQLDMDTNKYQDLSTKLGART